MSDDSTPAGEELAKALGEVLDDVAGKKALPQTVISVPDRIDIRATRQRLGMSQKVFAGSFGFEVRLLQDWEQGRRNPTGHARAYLLVIGRNPEAVLEALQDQAAEVAAE